MSIQGSASVLPLRTAPANIYVQVTCCIVLDRLVTTRATPTQKLLVRLVIHPSIWVVVTMYFRHLGRHIGGYGSAPCTSLGLAISCG